MTVTVMLEIDELHLQIRGRPEEGAVQTFAPNAANQAFNEGMGQPCAPMPPESSKISAGLYTCSMAGGVFYKLGQIAGGQGRKAKWMWESVAGSEAEGIQAEHAVGRDMAAVVLEETPRDSDRATQALLDGIGGKTPGG